MKMMNNVTNYYESFIKAHKEASRDVKASNKEHKGFYSLSLVRF